MSATDAGHRAVVESARWLRPGVLLMDVDGELDMLTAPELARRIKDATRFSPAYLVLDLSQVTFLGSSGLQVLVNAIPRDDSPHNELHLVVPLGHRTVRRPLELIGVQNVIYVHHSVEDLLCSLDHKR